MTQANTELIRYLELTPKSRALWQEAAEYLPGGDSRHSIFWEPYPIFVDSSSGCHVVDADGVDRLDFINTMTTLILGHGPEPVVQAVREQLDRGVVYNAPSENQIRLAKLLCERIPSFDLVRFTNSGTEATMNTLRAARAFTGKSRFAKVEGGYHGTHDAVTVSLRVDPEKAGDALRPAALPSSAGLPEGVLDQVVIIPFNETAVALRLLEENKDQLAAVIVEPVMGSVGMVPASSEFLAMLREFTREHGIILIFDEVISFRVAPGGGQQYYGITPDMTAMGKIIGGGFAVGAFGGRRDIMELYDPSKGAKVSHAGTFNANPVTMLAGAVTLEQLTPEVYRRLAELTERLRSGISQVCADLEVPVQVTGLGSLFGIHFTEGPVRGYRDVAAEDARLRGQVFLGLLNEGILTASNLVGALSTVITEAEVDIFVAAFKRVLARQR
ncbi:MAG: aspartate aminotransferase family protein [Dehalococcoidia bacterium]|jgi:glutamate-1-semialdehyde 2,1-aminomutase|nr:aspartate aminotransferase family protein [Dehalococcoidia bacterium]MDP6226576.1 aspartate aminotransferase family protein [Dehalococcoidia bacterium]MDP7200229.1 aspartate aminotransferase family protein [Dehalococcoidia bacterium]MDP7511703.1 aspartate aminotransferase family protein [Dehalococcoidia bacterium]HJN86555.1 aspartate aminotransferase family protein [Dehalococcoidia bacterium]